MKLLIVESPNKIKKLKTILGEGWEVAASVGHIRDLPLKELGIDKANSYKLSYSVMDNKKKVVQNLQLKVKAAGAENVYLATDPDREGEAISYHLCRELHLSIATVHRVTFNEITDKAVKSAVGNPRKLDLALVAAQESRRCIDRMVGYEVSPILWQFIKGHSGLSAGRVQSVAVRLVADREEVITSFGDKFKFAVSGSFLTVHNEKLNARLNGKNFTAEAEAANYLDGCKPKKFFVGEISTEETQKEPQAPFSTSVFQQEAFKKLKLSAAKAMELAQKLFEAGLITYMRTDSINISEEAVADARTHIEAHYGPKYFQRHIFKNKNDLAQEAHEAIRPTHFETITSGLGADEEKIYQLIFLRTLSSQMAAARYNNTTITILNDKDEDKFLSTASVLLFDGFLKAYEETEETDGEDEDEESTLKYPVEQDENLIVNRIKAMQKFDRPPKRFDEASLIKELEKRGIGRPSTYAAILAVITGKAYIKVDSSLGKKLPVITLELALGAIKKTSSNQTLGADKNKFFPTDPGRVIVTFLKRHFSEIIDYEFTAKIEGDFDRISEKKDNYLSVIQNFDQRLSGCIALTKKEATSIVTIDNASSGIACPKCKKGMIRFFDSVIKCSLNKKEDSQCNFVIFREMAHKKLTDSVIKQLLNKKKTGIIKGFKSKAGKEFDAYVVLKDDFTAGFEFSDKK